MYKNIKVLKGYKIMKMNKKVICFSILALGFLALTYLIDWLFIIGAVILVYFNQRDLLKKK